MHAPGSFPLRSLLACSLLVFSHALAAGAAYLGTWPGGAALYVEVEVAEEAEVGSQARLRVRGEPRPHTATPGPWFDAAGTVAWGDDLARVEATAAGLHAGETEPFWPLPPANGGTLGVRLEASTLAGERAFDPFGRAVLTVSGPSPERAIELRLEGVGTRFSSRSESADGTLNVFRAAPFFYADPWRSLDLAGRLAADVVEVLSDGLQQRRELPRSVVGVWTDERTAHVMALSESLVSVLYLSFVFTGGAHPNTWLESETYVRDAHGWRAADLCTALDALALPCREEALRAHVIEDLRVREAAWVVAGEVTAATPWLLDTFTLTATGLRFEFSPYAVGPYAQGNFVAFVPFAKLIAW